MFIIMARRRRGGGEGDEGSRGDVKEERIEERHKNDKVKESTKE